MGPSILAAAFTTVCAAVVMLFCQVTFFTKFAVILLITISMATIASFVVFVVLMETLGPSRPAYLLDQLCPRKTQITETKKLGAESPESPKFVSEEVNLHQHKYPFQSDDFVKDMEYYKEASC